MSGQVSIEGWVDLSLSFNLPLPFSLMPAPVVSMVGDRILDSILSRMQVALTDGLLADYYMWQRQQHSTPKTSAAADGQHHQPAVGSPN
eukprot:SM000032S12170  [mRNA]  locus=s32:887674:888062:- [translate_table: standard]